MIGNLLFNKRIIGFMLLLLQFLSISAYDFEVNGIYYNVLDLNNLECEVTSGDQKYEGSITIPSKVEFGPKTFTVRKIGDEAFYLCQKMTDVKIPESIKYIGNNAFQNCDSMESIIIPDSVLSIGKEAFSWATKLKRVSIGDAVTEIGDDAFYNCVSINELKVGKSVKNIGRSAFAQCESLKNVILPNSVETIGEGAFYQCSALNKVELGNGLKELKCGTFYLCNNLIQIRIPGSVERIIGYRLFDDSSVPFTELRYLSLPRSNKELVLGEYGYDDVFITGESNSKEQYYPTGDQWISGVTTIYINRRLNSDIKLPNLSFLSIGKDIKKVQIKDLQNCDKLKTIICDAPDPPVLPECSTKQYLNVVVEVPQDYLEKYKEAPVWKNFWNLKGYRPTKE